MTLISQAYSTRILEDTVYFTVAVRANEANWIDPLEWRNDTNLPILYLPPPQDIPGTFTTTEDDRGYAWKLYPYDTAPVYFLGDVGIEGFTEPYLFNYYNQVQIQPPPGIYWYESPSGRIERYPQAYPTYYDFVSRRITVHRRRRYRHYPVSRSQALKPNYSALLKGYELDPRVVPEYPVIIPAQSKQIKISYYRENRLEPYPDLRSIDWMVYVVDLVKNQPVTLPIVQCVLGTLYCDDTATLSQISGLPDAFNSYKWSDLLPSGITSLFANWNGLHTASIQRLSIPGNAVRFTIVNEISRTIRRMGANNNHWNNRSSQTSDLNLTVDHPMFYPEYGYQKAYERYIQTQPDGSYGVLSMDSPRTIEIHTALNAGMWALNTIDPTKPRVDNLGWRINRLCEILGIRVKPDGKTDEVLVKKKIRTVIDKSTKLDKDKIGIGNFGDDGMVVKRINNRFNGKEIVSDQCVILHDLIQLIQEYQDQSNLALGIQESSAIEVSSGKNTARFDNQLQLLVELFNLVNTTTEMQRSTLISSLVGQAQTSEIIAGLGLPSVTKTIPITINKKTSQLPYKGISPHRSISQEVATCTANVGIVLGQLI